MQTLMFQLQGELWKLFARKRTYMGFVAFAFLQLALFFIFHWLGGERRLRERITMQGQAFDHYFSALTLGHIITGLSVFLLGALYLSLVSGDIVAKESEDGHMRLLLVRPISRLRLLALKYVACTSYAFVLMQFAAYAALLLGFTIRGWGGGLFALAPEFGIASFFDGSEGMNRYAIGAAALGLGMTTVSSIGFCFSCMKIKPAAATIAALSYVLIDFIVRQSNLMPNHEHFLLTKHMAVWGRVFMEDIPWAVLIRSYSVLFAVNASLFVIGAAVFQSRDLKS